MKSGRSEGFVFAITPNTSHETLIHYEFLLIEADAVAANRYDLTSILKTTHYLLRLFRMK